MGKVQKKINCFYPVTVYNKKGQVRKVRCGKCAPCLSSLRNEKFIRLREELKDWDYTSFVTLTYSDENLTYGLNPTINVRDIQLFLKRLRKSLGSKKITYYLVGEYGTKFKRPHYHMIVFGLSKVACKVYIENAWKLGLVHIGQLNDRSINYVCKYHVLRNKNVPEGVQKPFLLSSKGIGEGYILREKKWHNEGMENRYFYMYYQYKLPLPRYYKDKIFDEVNRELLNAYFAEKYKNVNSIDIKTRKEMYRELLLKKRKDAKFGFKITDKGVF